MNSIEEMIKDLSIEEKNEIINFIEFIKYQKKKKSSQKRNIKFSWAGTLENITEYSSVDLQHKALDWMTK